MSNDNLVVNKNGVKIDSLNELSSEVVSKEIRAILKN